MDITVGMFAQICVIILCACAASLTLLDWHLSKKTVHTSAGAVDFKGDRVFAQPDKTFVLDTATFILAVEDIQRVADVDEVLRRVRREVSEKTNGEVVGPEGPCGAVGQLDIIPGALKTEGASDDTGRVAAIDQCSVVAVA